MGDEDIRALLDEKLASIPEAFTLETMQVSYGNQSVPTATVRIRKLDGEVFDEVAIGNGSVDAIYKAIDKVTKEEVELGDYSIKSVSHGKDALGEVHVVLRQNGIAVSGRGISTDILEASAKAYVHAVNRLLDKRASQTASRNNVTLI
ncbi:2-isopropylmalate synthase [compost metagenome]